MNKRIAIVLGLAIASGSAVAADAKSGLGVDLGVNAKVGNDIDLGVKTGVSLKQQFNAIDSDGNGVISKSEASANADLKSDFDTFDDGDGKLTRGEFTSGLKARAEGRLKSNTNANNSGLLEDGKSAVGAGTDATVDATVKAAGKTKEAAGKAASKSREMAGAAASKTKAGVKAGAEVGADAAGSVKDGVSGLVGGVTGAAGGATAGAKVDLDLTGELRNRFLGLDDNNDGVVSKSEAKADADISSSFAAGDADNNGLLTGAEFEAAASAEAEAGAEKKGGFLRGLFGG